MSPRNARLVFFCKLLVASIAIVAVVAVASRRLAPAVPLGQLVLYCAVGVVGVMALIVAVTICSLQFWQFILRAGGTDPQWFWFPGEPRGLVALRKQQAEAKAARDSLR